MDESEGIVDPLDDWWCVDACEDAAGVPDLLHQIQKNHELAPFDCFASIKQFLIRLTDELQQLLVGDVVIHVLLRFDGGSSRSACSYR